jgi:hypothetical protein
MSALNRLTYQIETPRPKTENKIQIPIEVQQLMCKSLADIMNIFTDCKKETKHTEYLDEIKLYSYSLDAFMIQTHIIKSMQNLPKYIKKRIVIPINICMLSQFKIVINYDHECCINGGDIAKEHTIVVNRKYPILDAFINDFPQLHEIRLTFSTYKFGTLHIKVFTEYEVREIDSVLKLKYRITEKDGLYCMNTRFHQDFVYDDALSEFDIIPNNYGQYMAHSL